MQTTVTLTDCFSSRDFGLRRVGYKQALPDLKSEHRLTALGIRWVILAWLCMFHAAPGLALEPANGNVLLTISGNITKRNAGDQAHIDQGILDSLPVTRFKTKTAWDEGVIEFEGVTLKHLLEHVGAKSSSFTASAIDEYEVEFMGVDLSAFPIIIAFKQDGQPLSVRTLGPLRIMFPFDDFPELDTQTNLTLSVWQLVAMKVH